MNERCPPRPIPGSRQNINMNAPCSYHYALMALSGSLMNSVAKSHSVLSVQGFATEADRSRPEL